MQDNEWQVTNQEISKRLKELGCKQESLWYYRILAEHSRGYSIVLGEPEAGDEFKFSAYTVAELGEILKNTTFGFPVYSQNTQIWFSGNTNADTEANARGKMLIYLLENNLI